MLYNSKSILTVTLFVVIFSILLWNCSKNPQNDESRVKDQSSLIISSQGVAQVKSFVDAKAIVSDLAKKMASNIKENSDALSQVQHVQTPISAMNFSSEYTHTIITSDGKMYAVTLEKAQPSLASFSKSNPTSIIAPDPDMFQPDEKNDICEGWLAKDGMVEQKSFDIEEYRDKHSGIPLILVGCQNSNDKIPQALQKVNYPLSPSGDYLVVTKIRQKKDYDPYTNEEFELYLRQRIINDTDDPYDYHTDFLFDGTSKYDAAGRYVYFPDINSAGVWYDMPSGGISLFDMDYSIKRGFIASEDDEGDEGQRVHEWDKDPLPPPPPGPDVWTDVVDIQYADGSKDIGRTRKFWWWTGDFSIINHDDTIKKGAYEKFYYDSKPKTTTAGHYALNENDFYLKREKW